jgi:protease-4
MAGTKRLQCRAMSRRSPRVLEIELGQEPAESPSAIGLFRHARVGTLAEIEEAIRRAARDPRIRGLLVRLEAPVVGWAKAQSLHRRIGFFRSSGKPTLAWISGGGNAGFLVASAAERVILDPSAALDVHALASDTLFFTDLLGELGVEAELDHVGDFKSAAEIFERRESSPAHRVQMDALLSDLSEQMLSMVAAARALSREQVADSFARGPFLPEEALGRGLVDEIADSVRAEELLGEWLSAKPDLVAHRRYLSRGSLRRRLARLRWPRVAVVHAVGIITGGDGPQSLRGPRSVGARALSELLAGLREHRRVRAVVVRVESPGGGALASDRIRVELRETARVKPVVVSMGDVAASGGYYVATAAHRVVAEGATLTGSIGVIGGKFVVKRLLDRLGIHHETRRTGDNATLHSPFRSFSGDERSRHREFLRYFYEKRFLPAVADARRFDLKRADELGRGRVWTGRQAQENGLIDSLGGLDEAIDAACSLAGLSRERARIVTVAPRRRWRDLLSFGVSAWSPSASGPLAAWGDALSLVEELAREDLLLFMPRSFRIR